MPLVLVRHTRPAVDPTLCYGRWDLEPAESFPDDAAAVSGTLPTFTRVVTSPATRCRRLADHLADGSDTGAPVVDERLSEMNFGRWEGRPWGELPRQELDTWAADFFNARPHGGETVAELFQRATQALRHWCLHSGDETVVVVTHLGVIRAALAARDGDAGWQARVGFGGFVEAIPCNASNQGAG